jgi:hypothetical protein
MIAPKGCSIGPSCPVLPPKMNSAPEKVTFLNVSCQPERGASGLPGRGGADTSSMPLGGEGRQSQGLLDRSYPATIASRELTGIRSILSQTWPRAEELPGQRVFVLRHPSLASPAIRTTLPALRETVIAPNLGS